MLPRSDQRRYTRGTCDASFSCPCPPRWLALECEIDQDLGAHPLSVAAARCDRSFEPQPPTELADGQAHKPTRANHERAIVEVAPIQPVRRDLGSRLQLRFVSAHVEHSDKPPRLAGPGGLVRLGREVAA